MRTDTGTHADRRAGKAGFAAHRRRFAAAIVAMVALAFGAVAGWAAEPQPTPPTSGAEVAVAETADREWSAVQVVTDQGWTISDAAVRWTTDGALIRVIRPDGSWQDFPPEQVNFVYAADGADLTTEITAARPGGITYSEVGQPGSAARWTNLGDHRQVSRSFRYAVTIGGGYAAYAGEWYDGFDSSPSIQGTIRIGTGTRSWITASYRRQGGGSESGTIDDGTGTLYPAKGSARVDEFFAAFGFLVGNPAKKNVVPYTEIGLGLLHHVANIEVAGVNVFSASIDKLGLVVQAGALIGVGDKAVLDVGFDVTHKTGIFDSYEPGGMIFGAHAGFGVVGW